MMDDDPKTVWDHIRRATDMLRDAGVAEPFASARVLMSFVLGVPTARLALERTRKLQADEARAFAELVERRASGEPVAYITGEREFFSMPFAVREGAFVPRPETEHVVEAVLDAARRFRRPAILDIGTGTGCIAIAVAKHLDEAFVVAADVSAAALECARENLRRHGLGDRVRLVRADAVSCFAEAFDIVVSNPPYVAAAEWDLLSREVRNFEPREALVSGKSGFEFIERMVQKCPSVVRSGGFLIFEVGDGQAERACELAKDAGWEIIDVIEDWSGVPRVVVAKKRGRE